MKRLVVSAACIAVTLVATILCAPAVSSADTCPIVVPTSLSPGDQYRLAFVTSGTRDAQSTDIADYNAFVTAAANAVPALAALQTQWFAIASTATVDARDNTGTAPPGGVPVFLLDDTMLAASYDDLWDWSIAVPWDVTELCTTATGSLNIWTGTNGFGMADQALGIASPTIGSRAATTDQEWVRFGATASTANHRLYAISDVLRTPSVPNESRTWGNIKGLYR